MRRLDRYILKEFFGPFLFGLGVFFVLLAGVDLLYDALRYIVRENMPAGMAAAVIGYRMPMVAALTLPMATLFAALMCFGRMSSEGEIIAMRAGGVPIARISAAVLVVAAVMSVAMAVAVHSWIPRCNGRSRELLMAFRTSQQETRHLLLRIPERGELERIVYVDRLNLAAGEMEGVIIHEFRRGRPWATYVAKRGRWDGRQWVLQGVEHTVISPDGIRSERLGELVYDIGRSPEDIERIKYDPDELPTAELRRELEVVSRGPARDEARAAQIRAEIANRWATPWSILSFALIGVVLGVRPQRASKGVALGISLIVILAYYILMHTMTIVSEQGRLPAEICAWLPNVILYVAGIAGLAAHDR